MRLEAFDPATQRMMQRKIRLAELAGDDASATEIRLDMFRMNTLALKFGYRIGHYKDAPWEPNDQIIYDERDEKICEAIRAGDTLAAIGNRYSLTRERVRQIAKHYGVRSSLNMKRIAIRTEKAAAKQAANNAKREARLALEARFYDLVNRGNSIASSGRMLGLTESQTATLSKRLGLGKITQFGRWRGGDS